MKSLLQLSHQDREKFLFIPLWSLFFLFCSFSQTVLAQAKPVISITPTCDTPRSHSPLLFEANVVWEFPKVLEGTLHLEFYVAERKVHTWISRELALSNSEIKLPVMAPAVMLNDSNQTLDIKVTFVSAEKTYTYEDELNMLNWPDWKRVFVVGIVHPELSTLSSAGFLLPKEETGSAEQEWVRHFRLDHKLPHPKLSSHFVSRSVGVDPSHISTVPLELTGYDLLVLTRDGLRGLTSEQLDSIAAWNAAGGMVCVFGGPVSTVDSQEFIKRILVSEIVDPKVKFEADGTMRSLVPGQTDWQLASPGIGRSMVIFNPVDERMSEWQMDLLKLWRMKSYQRQHVAQSGKWSYPEPVDGYSDSADFGKSLLNYLYHPMSPVAWSEDRINQILMPDRVEGVPLRSVAMLLLLCLLAVGPGDYYLLGFLGKRRWTWLLFPLIAISFAMYTIRMAQSHMGQTDHLNSLEIVDLAADGTPVKLTRFELMFAASEKEIQTERRQEFCVTMENRTETDNQVYGHTPQDPLIQIGRVPLNYVSVRDVHQWKPQVSRSTLLGISATVDMPSFDWSLVHIEALKTEETISKLSRQIHDAFPDSTVIVMHGKNSSAYRNNIDLSNASDDKASTFLAPGAEKTNEIDSMIKSISSNGEHGPFQVLSQLAPNAGGNFEDLTLLDPSDPHQYLLLILTADKAGNHKVYRRLVWDDAHE